MKLIFFLIFFSSSKISSRKKVHKQPNLIKALAFRNGSREGSFLVTARNINEVKI